MICVFLELQTSQPHDCLLTGCDLILCPCKIHLVDGILPVHICHFRTASHSQSGDPAFTLWRCQVNCKAAADPIRII